MARPPTQMPLFSPGAPATPGPILTREESTAPPRPWTVTELTAKIRGTLEPAFPSIWIQGEVSNYRPAASGHAYFSLKDSGASVSAAAFGWGAKRRPFELRDGLEVICRGRLTVYPPRGSYQLTVDHLEPVGAGALQQAFEALKAQLQGEGLFDPARKRALPRFPERIAIVTSPTGAAVQDMLNILRRRAPHVRVLVIPALVQGAEAPRHLLRALEAANRHSLGDVVVLARGGGSIEDLWAFNDENLARAIAASRLPVVSAVGHEVDFTISDFVADLRAPTPSAAAEILTGGWVDALSRFADHRRRLASSIARELMIRRQLLDQVAARVVSPQEKLRDRRRLCEDLRHRLRRAADVRLERARTQLGGVSGRLHALSPLQVLERGYTLVQEDAPDGRVLRSARQVVAGAPLRVRFHDGERKVLALPESEPLPQESNETSR